MRLSEKNWTERPDWMIYIIVHGRAYCGLGREVAAFEEKIGKVHRRVGYVAHALRITTLL